MKHIARETRAGPTAFIHPHAASGLHAEDTVLAVDVARDGDAALALVGGGSATRRARDGAAAVDVVGGFRCGGGVGVGRRERGTTIVVLGGGGGAVSAVEVGVVTEEAVVGLVGFVAGSCEGEA